METLGGLTQNTGVSTNCALPVNIAIGIAGKQFPINLFDIWGPAGSTSVNCTLRLDVNDPPTGTEIPCITGTFLLTLSFSPSPVLLSPGRYIL